MKHGGGANGNVDAGAANDAADGEDKKVSEGNICLQMAAPVTSAYACCSCKWLF
jgi:hypothetical protein